MPNAKQVVDDILGQHDYVFPILDSGSGLDSHSVDVVVRVALYQEDNREWGINRLNRLSRMLESLVRRLNTEEGYPDYVEDTARVMTGLETVVSGALAEEIVEDLAEEIAEDLEEGVEGTPKASGSEEACWSEPRLGSFRCLRGYLVPKLGMTRCTP
jgi:hypothetical protein